MTVALTPAPLALPDAIPADRDPVIAGCDPVIAGTIGERPLIDRIIARGPLDVTGIHRYLGPLESRAK